MECLRELCKLLDDYEKPNEQLLELAQSIHVDYNILKAAWNHCLRDMTRLNNLIETQPQKLVDLYCETGAFPLQCSLDKRRPNLADQNKERIVQDVYYASKFSYLTRIALYVSLSLVNSGQTCMTCDGCLDFVGLKPAVCQAPTCQFQFCELGLGFNLAHEIQTQRKIMDMYISMMCSSIQANKILLCFPRGVRSRENQSFMNGSTPDPAKLKNIVDKIPNLQQLQQHLDDAKNSRKNEAGLPADSYLRKQLKKVDPLIYPLLKWIVTSNRAYLRELRPNERFKDIHTTHQFFFANASPEKEAEFQRLKREAEEYHGKGKGVIQAWHGSPFGNWHSIMRNGLQNMSGTKHQMHGAAYGKGIYFALNMSVSLSYSRRSSGGWVNSEIGTSLYGIALCEIINHRNLPKANPYLVITDESWVMTRFFFLANAKDFNKLQNKDLVAANVKIPNELRRIFDTVQ